MFRGVGVYRGLGVGFPRNWVRGFRVQSLGAVEEFGVCAGTLNP